MSHAVDLSELKCPLCEHVNGEHDKNGQCAGCRCRRTLLATLIPGSGEPLTITPTDPLTDTSRWTITAARYETPPELQRMFDEMFTEWIATLPADSPARLLYDALPKPPRPNRNEA